MIERETRGLDMLDRTLEQSPCQLLEKSPLERETHAAILFLTCNYE